MIKMTLGATIAPKLVSDWFVQPSTDTLNVSAAASK
jgi:hypothetical protein